MNAYTDLIDRIGELSGREARAALMLLAYQHDQVVSEVLDRIQEGTSET